LRALRQVPTAGEAGTIETPAGRENTTLVVVLVAAPADSNAVQRCCGAAHDAMARVIVPCHTIFDGDVAFAASVEDGTPTPVEMLPMTIATELAVERAIRDAVTA
jgi:L-aminopeptidase/D-esterase-like protein